ncbi:MAG: hypothetical protein ACYCPP_04140, partial [Nitrososphaerales archaeon]
KITGSNRFEDDWTLAILLIVEGMVAWLAITFAEPVLAGFMVSYWTWFFCVNFALTALYFVWFSNAIEHDIMEIPVAILTILAVTSGLLAFVF